MNPTTFLRAVRLAVLVNLVNLALPGLPAWAHHPMGGAVPATFWQGLLSGLLHPVIGLDHLAFLLAAGLGAAWAVLRGVGPAVAFLVAAMAAAALRLPEVPPAVVEAGVAATLMALALMLLTRRLPGTGTVFALAVAAGLLHGHAFGEAVIGAAATPLLAYLAGLALVQALVLVLAWHLAMWMLWEHPRRVASARRVAGSLLAAAGTAAMAGLLAR